MKENRKNKISTYTSDGDNLEELQRQAAYYKQLSDEVAGYNILVDSKHIILKSELENKRLGHDLLRKLHEVVGSNIDRDRFFASTLKLMLTTLNLDRAFVFWKNKDTGEFEPRWHKGLDKKNIARLKDQVFDFQFFNKQIKPSVLINKSVQRKEQEVRLCEELDLPFLVGTPIRHGKDIDGWLIGGREKEALPFYPALNHSDLENFEIIASFIRATTLNMRLYTNLERANERLANYNKELELEVEKRTRDIEISRKELEKEKIKSDKLLLNILPAEIADELKESGSSEAKSYDSVAIMFTDFENFTAMAETVNPKDLVRELHVCFTKFDEIANKYGIEKIKTIGDSYMAVGGLNTIEGDFTADVIRAGLDMQAFVRKRQKKEEAKDFSLNMRVGVHSGSVVAGIVGVDKFQYDIWGDAVNMASRLESAAPNGTVNISKSTYELVKDIPDFVFTYRGKVKTKRKGDIEMWLVDYS